MLHLGKMSKHLTFVFKKLCVLLQKNFSWTEGGQRRKLSIFVPSN